MSELYLNKDGTSKRERTVFMTKQLIYLLVFCLPVSVLAQAQDEVPKYKIEDLVGPSYPMNAELDLRIKGIITGNRYQIRDANGIRIPDESYGKLNAQSDGSYVFTIHTPSTPALRLKVTAHMLNGQLTIRFRDNSEKKKKELPESVLTLSWKTPDQKSASSVVAQLNKISDSFDDNAGFKAKDSFGYGPANYRQMATLALFLVLKKQSGGESKSEVSSYFKLLDHLFKDMDRAIKG